jgi:hypothetical protein
MPRGYCEMKKPRTRRVWTGVSHAAGRGNLDLAVLGEGRKKNPAAGGRGS